MKGEKIGTLNSAIQSLLQDIIEMSEDNIEIYVRTLAYNDIQQWMDGAPTRIEDYCWNDISASGNSSAKDMFTELISEFRRFKICKKNVFLIPVLFSGTIADDNYEKELKKLESVPIFRKGIKVGVTIGQNADIDMLNRFTGNKESVLYANDLYLLKKLIRWDDDAWFDDEWAEEASLETIYVKSIDSLDDTISV